MLKLSFAAACSDTPAIARAGDWLSANRCAATHSDPNLRGGVPDARARKGDGFVQLDLGASFALRLLTPSSRAQRSEAISAGCAP